MVKKCNQEIHSRFNMKSLSLRVLVYHWTPTSDDAPTRSRASGWLRKVRRAEVVRNTGGTAVGLLRDQWGNIWNQKALGSGSVIWLVAFGMSVVLVTENALLLVTLWWGVVWLQWKLSNQSVQLQSSDSDSGIGGGTVVSLDKAMFVQVPMINRDHFWTLIAVSNVSSCFPFIRLITCPQTSVHSECVVFNTGSSYSKAPDVVIGWHPERPAASACRQIPKNMEL